MNNQQTKIQCRMSDTSPPSSALVLPRGSLKQPRQANLVMLKAQCPRELRRLEFSEEEYSRVFKVQGVPQCDCSQEKSPFAEGTVHLLGIYNSIAILCTVHHCVMCTDCGKLFKAVRLIFLRKGIQPAGIPLNHYSGVDRCFDGDSGEILINALPVAVIIIKTDDLKKFVAIDIKKLPRLLSTAEYERLFPMWSAIKDRISTGCPVKLVGKPVMEPDNPESAAYNLHSSQGQAWREDSVCRVDKVLAVATASLRVGKLNSNCKSAKGMSGGLYEYDDHHGQKYLVGVHDEAVLNSHTIAVPLTHEFCEDVKTKICSLIPKKYFEPVGEKRLDEKALVETAIVSSSTTNGSAMGGAAAAGFSQSLSAHDSGLVHHRRAHPVRSILRSASDFGRWADRKEHAD